MTFVLRHLARRSTAALGRAALFGSLACGGIASGQTAASAPDSAASLAAHPECSLPPELLALKAPLAALRAAVEAKKPVRIVAIGSSSTLGIGASSGQMAYPAQLESLLRRAWPGVAVTVLNKGVGGDEAQQMLRRWPQDVRPEAAQLVIWQVGSNHILRNSIWQRPGFDAAVRSGVAQAREARTDLLIMGPQWAPKLDASGEQPWMLERLPALARELSVPYLDRHTAFVHWRSKAGLPESAWIGLDQLHPTDTAYRCTALALAAVLQRAVQP